MTATAPTPLPIASPTATAPAAAPSPVPTATPSGDTVGAAEDIAAGEVVEVGAEPAWVSTGWR